MEKFQLQRSELIKLLKQKYGEKFNKLVLVDFSNLESFIDNQDLSALKYPGVYAIHCLSTNRSFITFSVDNIIGDMEYDLHKLKYSRFEVPRDLVKDYDNYGFESFMFIVLDVYPEYPGVKKLQQEIQLVENSWPLKLY